MNKFATNWIPFISILAVHSHQDTVSDN